jgi:integrase
MSRVNLTERRIEALEPDPTGKRRVELRDAVVPGLIVRIAAKRKVFALHARFPNTKNPTRRPDTKNPTRRVIGEYGAVTLDAARSTARQWLELIRKGIDPQSEVRRREEEALRAREQARIQQEGLFARVADDYLTRKVAGQRQARPVERIVRYVLVPAWDNKLVNEITRRDVVKLIEEINDRPAPIYAHAVFGVVRALFNWAVHRDIYNIAASPCDRVKIGELMSRPKEPRQRTLSDDELRAFWKATGRMDYPWGPLFRMLLLTGTRKTEAAGAQWKEFELDKARWVVPLVRFKSKTPHLVCLSGDALALVAGLPKFSRGDHLFSFDFGATPSLILHKAKLKLDALMLRYLRAAARLRGDDPAAVKLEPWLTHDLRHVVRTKLADLEVNDTVAEMVLGHGKRGLQRVYDQSKREPQMRRALEAWAAELRRVVSPPQGGNVVPLRGQGA